jgi:DNA-directed RNA polymerase specialized sigma24 family protein
MTIYRGRSLGGNILRTLAFKPRDQPRRRTMVQDILAFGQELIAARPRLRAAAQSLCGEHAGMLVTRIIDDAWRARNEYHPGQDLDAWLQDMLRRSACKSGA